MTIQSARPASPPRSRRTRNHWEPFFDPDLNASFEERDWDFTGDKGPIHKRLSGTSLDQTSARPTKFSRVHFETCDFSGHIGGGRTLVFEECRFTRCDFGLSTWNRVKFTRCLFEASSFSQSTLKHCEFRSSRWLRIGFAGSETIMTSTLIDNPGHFLDARWINLDAAFIEEHRNRQPEFTSIHASPLLYEIAKHEATKEAMSRTLLENLRSVGSEDAFYEAGKANLIQRVRANIAWNREAVFNRRGLSKAGAFVTYIGSHSELAVLVGMGWINAWGRSVVRPLTLLILTVLSFGLIYWHVFGLSGTAAIAKAFEITSIAGYTRGAAQAPSRWLRFAEWTNLVSSIVFYTVFFATAVARFCRVR